MPLPESAQPARQRVLAWRHLVLALLAAAWLASLGVRPLYKPDEARYGEIAREMVQSGDWVTPRLNGFKYFEKPPLQYWATAAAFKLFGTHDWTARLWAGLLALAGVAMVFAAGNCLFGPPAGALAAALLAASPLYLLYGQFTTLDMGVGIFLTAAVLSFTVAQQPGERRPRAWMLCAWAACAAAVLSKGLIGIVLPAATVALYVLIRRDWNLLGRLELLRGALLFLALTVPWFAAVSLRNPEFAHFFFVQEHWLRFTTTMHHRSHPAWYFVPVLALGMAPWLLVVLAAWTAALRRPGPGFSAALFLALWALVVFVFFSASGSKLPGYILPLLPALAVLGAAFLARKAPQRLLIAQSTVVALAGLGLAAASPYLARIGSDRHDQFATLYSGALLAAATALAAAGVLASLLALRSRSHASVGVIALGAFAAILIAVAGHRVYAPVFSAASTIAAISPPPPEAAPFFAVDSYDHTVPWSLRRTVTMVRYKDELDQAVSWEPSKFIPDLAGFAREWSAAPNPYALFALHDFDRLRNELGLPMEIVARGARYVIVRKP